MTLDALGRIQQARGLHEKAVAEGRFGHAARAIATLNRALELIQGCDGPESDVLTVEIWLSLSVNEAEVHGVERGLALAAEAERLATAIVDPSLKVRSHSNFGFIASRAGDFELAMTQLDLATALIDDATPHDRFAILLNSGNLRLYTGDLRGARRQLTLAADAADAEDLADGRFKALHNLGYAEFLAGNLPSALASMDRAATLDVEVSRGIWALDRARILVESGLTREADDTLAQAERIFRADRLAQDLGETEVARAECALVADDPQSARRFAARARDRFRRRGNVRWQRTAELVLLQGDLRVGRPGSILAPVAARLSAQLEADGLPLRARTAALVGVESLLSTGRVDAAAAVVAGLRPDAPSDPITARTHGRYVRARLALAQTDRSGARRQIRAGLTQLAAYQASFGSIDLRSASAIHGRRLAELDLSLALEDGRALGVLAAVERGRAVSSRLPSVQPPRDEQTAELLSDLRQVVESLHAAQSNTIGLLKRRRELESRIQQRTWTLSGHGGVARPASAAEIRAEAHAGEVTLAAYLEVDDRLHVVVVSAQGNRLVELGPAREVESLVRRARADFDVIAFERLPEGLRASATASLRRTLAGLDRALLAPLGPIAGRLVVVPTGYLGTVPWTALPSRADSPTSVAPSATAWLAASASAAAAASAGSASSVASAAAAEPEERPVLAAVAGPNLQRAEYEVAAVTSSWPFVASNPRGARRELLDAFAEASVVHVAAHGQHQLENPLFSSIQLADGPLFAHELVRTAPHVVLSACDLGLATIRPGDEALGLTSVLLQRGTRSVVSGIARVADGAAAELMIDYHRLLATGSPSDEALATAAARADAPAPFVCFGAAWSIAA
jgi:CHAT domain-containing protein/tetratricopeptide (TPR) repeat protein